MYSSSKNLIKLKLKIISSLEELLFLQLRMLIASCWRNLREIHSRIANDNPSKKSFR